MKSVKFLKAFLSLSLFSTVISLPAKAELADTSKKIIVASIAPRMVTEVYDINVDYPEIFDGHQEHTLEYIEKFAEKNRNYLIRIYQKSEKYFSKVSKVFEKYEIPDEFKILMALESQFNGKAVSRAGAVGYWQLMDAVAKDYGLKIPSAKARKSGNKIIDERTNFAKSTAVAARYLKDRAKELNNDWLLIAASYNWGIGNVRKAMKRTGLANPSFWDIKKYAPKETRLYVMNFITLNVIFNNYDKFLNNELRFEPTIITRPVNPLFNGINNS